VIGQVVVDTHGQASTALDQSANPIAADAATGIVEGEYSDGMAIAAGGRQDTENRVVQNVHRVVRIDAVAAVDRR